MMNNRYTRSFLSGTMAFGIYFFLLALLLFYFNSKAREKSVHYVKKNEGRIQVAMADAAARMQPKPKTNPQPHTVKPKPKPKPKPQPVVKKETPKLIEKPKPQPVVKPKPEPKVIKEKVVKQVKKQPPKKTVTPPKPQPKVIQPKSLFDNVSSSKPKSVEKPSLKPVIKNDTQKSSAKSLLSSLKDQKPMDSGIENAYLAKVEEKLQGWPAQSQFAGEKARVMLTIQPSGYFEFKIISGSGIPEFNQGLEEYLRQLQKFGFGPHEGGRAYELDVEFIAKD